MGKKLILVLCVLLLGLGTYVYFTPYIAVSDMRDAAETHDAAQLTEHVDFPAVRDSLKNEVRARISSLPSQDSGLGSIGAALAGAFVEPMVDTLVTPESIALMLQGIAPRNASAHGTGDPLVEASMGYADIGKFIVTITPTRAPSNAFNFILTRDGLFGWKLTGVRLPASWTLPSTTG